jgi:hypothetical protein
MACPKPLASALLKQQSWLGGMVADPIECATRALRLSSWRRLRSLHALQGAAA